MDAPYDLDEMLTKVGAGSIDLRIFFTSGLLIMVVIDDTMGLGMVAVDATCDLGMDAFKKGIFMTAGFVGIIVSSFFWGYLCDSQGRRSMLLVSTFSASAAAILSVFMPNYWSFVAMRFINGIFLAGPSSITPSYLGEFCTRKNLTAVMNYLFMVSATASIYCPTIGFVLLPQTWRLPIVGSLDFVPWRLQLILYNLPGFLAAISLIFLPESPAFLLTVGKIEEAYASISWLSLKHTGYSLDVLYPDLSFEDIAALLPKRQPKKHILSLADIKWQTRPVFRKPILQKFIISSLVMFGLFYIGNGLGIWYPTLRGTVRAYEHNTSKLAICDISDYHEDAHGSDVCTVEVKHMGAFDSIALGVFYTASFILQGIVLRFLSRRNTMLSELVVTVIFGTSLFWINETTVSLFVMIVYISLPTLMTAVMSGALVNMMPTHCRGTAICLCMMAGRLGAVIGSYCMGLLFESVCIVTMVLFLSSVFVCMVCIFFLPLDIQPAARPSLFVAASLMNLQTAKRKP